MSLSRIGILTAIALVSATGAMAQTAGSGSPTPAPQSFEHHDPVARMKAMCIKHFARSAGRLAYLEARLQLTADQQRHWPEVESALRSITYKKDGSQRTGKLAAVDPNSPAVQQLKSAAIPLIMSMSDAQKDEVRQLARLMGLEQVAASF